MEVAKKWTLELAKERKKKKFVNILKSKNDDLDISTQTCECFKSFLKKHDAIQKDNKQESIDSYALLKHLIVNSLEQLIKLSKTYLKFMAAKLKLTYRKQISKDDMIENFSDVMLKVTVKPKLK